MTCCITRPVLDKAFHLGELSGLTEIDVPGGNRGAGGRIGPADGTVFTLAAARLLWRGEAFWLLKKKRLLS